MSSCEPLHKYFDGETERSLFFSHNRGGEEKGSHSTVWTGDKVSSCHNGVSFFSTKRMTHHKNFWFRVLQSRALFFYLGFTLIPFVKPIPTIINRILTLIKRGRSVLEIGAGFIIFDTFLNLISLHLKLWMFIKRVYKGGIHRNWATNHRLEFTTLYRW